MDEHTFRIGISGSYGGLNLGDEAILACIIREIGKALPARFVIFSRFPDDTARRHLEQEAVNIRNLTRSEAKVLVEGLDLLILGGGGILYDRDVPAYLREVGMALEAGVPVAVYAVSAGPLDRPESRTLVAEHLNAVDLITVRDQQGKRLLEEAGVTQNILVTADPALLMEPEPLAPDALHREGLEPGRPIVGFSVREPGPAAPDMDVAHYQALLADAADFLVERHNAEIVFVPMERQKMDMQHSHAVISRMKRPQNATVLRGEYTPGELLSLVGHFDFVVGMRLHMLIFSAIQGIPFVALPYASKVTGLIEELQMDAPPLMDFNAGRLLANIDRSWDNQGEIKERIGRLLPPLKERARETGRLVTRLLMERTRTKTDS